MTHGTMARFICTAICIQLLSGCCGCDKKSKNYLCEGVMQGEDTLHHAIGTYEDAEKSKESAIWGACYTYCTEEDPTVDAVYQIWKATEDGQKSRLGRGSDIDYNSELEAIRDDCREKCEAKVASGLLTVGTKCHPPQGGVECTTTMERGGKTWKATEDGPHSKHHSRRMACRNYCKEGDADILKLYDEWKLSDFGKDSSFSTPQAAMEANDFLFEAVNSCQGNCMGELMTGKASADTKCE